MTPVCRSRSLRWLATLVAVTVFATAAFAGSVVTTAHPEARVSKTVNNGKRVTLYGHVPHVVAEVSPTGTAIDLGHLDPNTPMTRMRMVLRAVRNKSARCGESSTNSRTSAPPTSISG